MKITLDEIKNKLFKMLKHPEYKNIKVKISEESKQYDRLYILKKETEKLLDKL